MIPEVADFCAVCACFDNNRSMPEIKRTDRSRPTLEASSSAVLGPTKLRTLFRYVLAPKSKFLDSAHGVAKNPATVAAVLPASSAGVVPGVISSSSPVISR